MIGTGMFECWTQCRGSQEDIKWADKNIPHPGRAETRWPDLYLSPHMGSLLSFGIKSLVLRPREIESTKHPWGSPSSGGNCASLALFSLIPSFPSQHLFSWLLQSHPCPSCLCLAPRAGKAMDIPVGELLLCAQEIP